MQSGQSCACASRIRCTSRCTTGLPVDIFWRDLGGEDRRSAGPGGLVRPVISQAAMDRILAVIADATTAARGVAHRRQTAWEANSPRAVTSNRRCSGGVDNCRIGADRNVRPGCLGHPVHRRQPGRVDRQRQPYGLNAFVHTRDLVRALTASPAGWSPDRCGSTRSSQISPQARTAATKQSGFTYRRA